MCDTVHLFAHVWTRKINSDCCCCCNYHYHYYYYCYYYYYYYYYYCDYD